MKNLLLLLMMLCTMSLFAQEQREYGSDGFVLGGSLNFRHGNNGFTFTNQFPGIIYSNRGNTSFSFNPYIGKRFKNDNILGLRLGYAMNKSDIYRNTAGSLLIAGENKKSLHTIGVFYRYNVVRYQRIGFFLEPHASFAYGRDKLKFDDYPDASITNEYHYNIGTRIGISYRLSNSFNILANIGNLGHTLSSIEGNSDNLHNTYFNFSPSNIDWGIEYKF